MMNPGGDPPHMMNPGGVPPDPAAAPGFSCSEVDLDPAAKWTPT
jgi:hypothetical protein